MAQTPREKRFQSRAERTEKVQIKEGTAKVTTHKLKGKKHPTKQTKTVDTRLSTGSREEEQRDEKSPEILAREAAIVLTTLSTPPKPKRKRKRQTYMYFKARRSMQIKAGRPQPRSKEPIVIKDTTAKQKDKSPSKISITYERGSQKPSLGEK